jgi:hypothetical protein
VYVIPDQYTGSSTHGHITYETEPLYVLICGWKNQAYMSALLHELDRGHSQLPPGSHVTFFNEHPPEISLVRAEDAVMCEVLA